MTTSMTEDGNDEGRRDAHGAGDGHMGGGHDDDDDDADGHGNDGDEGHSGATWFAMRLESICCTKFAGDAPRSQEPQLHVHETCDGRAFLSNYNTVFSAQRFKGVKLSILAMRSASLSYQLLGLRADASCLSAEED